MKRNAMVIVVFTLIALTATPVLAQSNWVEKFLGRYKPIDVQYPAAAGTSQQQLADMIRSGQLPLTVGDMINPILSNNLDIGLNRLSPLSSRFVLDTMYRRFEPSINVSALVNRNTSPSTSKLSGDSISNLSHTYTIGFGQTLLSGTDLAVDFSMNRSSTNNPFSSFNPYWSGSIRYSFNQHLMRDLGRNINTRQIRQSENNNKISDIQFEENVINLVVQAQKAYWDLVFAAEDIKVKQRSMDLAQKTLSDNQKQVNVGTMAPIDLVQAESEVATRREQLVVATFSQTQDEDQVKKLITSQADPGMVLARLMPVQTLRRPSAGDVPAITDAIRTALENRPEMRQLALELKNKEIDVEYTRNQLLPNVDLSGSYLQSGLGGTEVIRDPTNFFSGRVLGIVPGGIGDAFGQMFRYNYTGYSLGLSVQIPIRNRAAQADNAHAATERKIAENRINTTAQQIALEVRNALTQVEMNRARIEAAEKSRELAERRLESEQKKFDLGASTVRFVLEEQRNVAQAQSNEISAFVNYTKALVDVERATGMSLNKNNVEVKGQ